MIRTVRGSVRRTLRGLAGTLVLCALSGTAYAQAGVSLQRASRAALIARADTLEQRLAGTGLRGKDRTLAQQELASTRQRLNDGDFQVGDRFSYTIIGDNAFSDSASVRDGYVVSISNLPDVSVQGVLRSELTAHLSAHVARYLKNATVRTNVLNRIAVVGAVARPGYLYIGLDRAVSELIMLAGGPVAQANLNEFEVHRNGQMVLTLKQSRRVLREGLTIEQADIRSGDEVRIPTVKSRRINWGMALQILFILSSLLLAFTQFIQWYYRDQ